MVLAWTVGLIIYLVKRRQQKRQALAAGYKSRKDYIFIETSPNPPIYIIPPDPALAGTHVEKPTPKQPDLGRPSEPQMPEIVEEPGYPPSPQKHSELESTPPPTTTASTPMLGTQSSIYDSAASFISADDSDPPSITRRTSNEGEIRR